MDLHFRQPLARWLTFYTILTHLLLFHIGLAQGQSSTDEPSLVQTVRYEQSFAALGTRVSLTAYSADEPLTRRAFEDAQHLVRKLESTLTDYRPESETRQLTQLAVNKDVEPSPHLWKVLMASDRWYRLSEGTFDAGLGELTSLWRKYRRAQRIPKPDAVSRALDLCGWQHVRLDQRKRSIRLARPIRLDFGGIGKGFIVDEVFELLRDRGLTSCLVNISGNIRCGTPPPDRAGWRVGISALEPGQPPLRIVELARTSMATSGDLWQYIEIDGSRHSHILDPSTGYGVLGPVAVTVIAAKAIDADACATAACILPVQQSLDLARAQGMQLLYAKQLDGEISLRTTGEFPPQLGTDDTQR